MVHAASYPPLRQARGRPLQTNARAGHDTACIMISAESKAALPALSRPPFAKCAENGAPFRLIVSARSKAGPPAILSSGTLMRTGILGRIGRRAGEVRDGRVGFVVAHPSKCDGWGIPSCGGIDNAGARLDQPQTNRTRITARIGDRKTTESGTGLPPRNATSNYSADLGRPFFV
jgi:hypothetical protein